MPIHYTLLPLDLTLSMSLLHYFLIEKVRQHLHRQLLYNRWILHGAPRRSDLYLPPMIFEEYENCRFLFENGTKSEKNA